jgi:hypothetical protein
MACTVRAGNGKPFAQEALRAGNVLVGKSANRQSNTLELWLPSHPVPFCTLYYHLKINTAFGRSETMVFIGWIHTIEPAQRFGSATRVLSDLEARYPGMLICGGRATRQSQPWLKKNGFALVRGNGEGPKNLICHERRRRIQPRSAQLARLQEAEAAEAVRR